MMVSTRLNACEPSDVNTRLRITTSDLKCYALAAPLRLS